MDATDADRLIKQARRELARPVRVKDDAALIALRLYLLSDVCRLADDPRVTELRDLFRENSGGWSGDELLASRVEYASRLANSPLMMEEMFKLFSLLDEIHALQALGFSVDEPVFRQLEADLRVRFRAQGAIAGMAALALAEEWNRSRWWYAERIPPGPIRRRTRRR
jgi:hypothetical protein